MNVHTYISQAVHTPVSSNLHNALLPELQISRGKAIAYFLACMLVMLHHRIWAEVDYIVFCNPQVAKKKDFHDCILLTKSMSFEYQLNSLTL